MSAKPAPANKLSQALRTVTVPDALEAFHELDSSFHIIPKHARDTIMGELTILTADVAPIATPNVLSLITGVPAALHSATGIEHPTRILNTHDSALVHPARNLLLALALAGAASIGADLRPVLDLWTTLRPRTLGHKRALVDDEIVLVRTMLAAESRDRDQRGLPTGFADCANLDTLTSTVAYALSESGLTSGELPSITLDDISWVDRTLYVSTLGSNVVASRIVSLDAFQSGVIDALFNRRMRDPNWPSSRSLIYSARQTKNAKNSAAVSAYNRLDHILKRAGVRSTDNTAASICSWSYQTTYDTQGLDAAVERSGYRQHLLTKRINVGSPATSGQSDRTDGYFDAFDDLD